MEQQKPVTFDKSAFTFWKSKREWELGMYLRWSIHPCSATRFRYISILKPPHPDNFRGWPKTNSANYFIIEVEVFWFWVWVFLATSHFFGVLSRLSGCCRLSSGERQIKCQFVSPVVSFSYYSYAHYTFWIYSCRRSSLFVSINIYMFI